MILGTKTQGIITQDLTALLDCIVVLVCILSSLLGTGYNSTLTNNILAKEVLFARPFVCLTACQQDYVNTLVQSS